jgi:hypothetical protein
MNPLRLLWEKPHECPVCGWQGMCEPTSPRKEALCPDCGNLMFPRSWLDTWGLTLIILGVVATVMLFVVYFGR